MMNHDETCFDFIGNDFKGYPIHYSQEMQHNCKCFDELKRDTIHISNPYQYHVKICTYYQINYTKNDFWQEIYLSKADLLNAN